VEKTTQEIMTTMSADTHWDLVETVNPSYRGLAIEFTDQIIREYDCKTNSEKALATFIANAYIRTIDNSRRFNSCAEAGEHLSDERTRYLAMLSKQIDRANRQFLSALTTLKQIKSPVIEMNIRTKNAFIAQNQQINADGTLKTNNSENNEAK
jgi:hypothetical protein